MELDELWTGAGAAAWGTCAYADLSAHMDGGARARAEGLCPRPAGVYVGAFPYYAGDGPGNLSRYARGENYHTALARRLETVRSGLEARWPEGRFVALVDNSPLPEGIAAGLAGLGLRGRNGLTILPPYGTWIFLGAILTDRPLPSARRPSPPCKECGACAAACPGQALGPDGLDPEKCLSALTQRKGALTEEEEARLRAHPLIWGCDVCQEVCPYNREVPLSPLPEFQEGLISTLVPADVEHLTRRQLQAAYPDRAFTWRGPGVLERNLRLKKEQTPPPPGPAGRT